MTKPLLSFQRVSFRYGKTEILKEVSLEIVPGEFVGLIGSNGAGKSTLVKLLLGRLLPDSGMILLHGNPPHKGIQPGLIGYVPQLGSGKSLHFPITVRELIGLSLYGELRGLKRLNLQQKVRVEEILGEVGLKEKGEEVFGHLSGGQRQRALLAKALVHRPSFLVFDEPTTGVDEGARKELYRMLHHYHKVHGITIFMITHELEEVKEYMDRVLSLSEGTLKEVKG